MIGNSKTTISYGGNKTKQGGNQSLQSGGSYLKNNLYDCTTSMNAQGIIDSITFTLVK